MSNMFRKITRPFLAAVVLGLLILMATACSGANSSSSTTGGSVPNGGSTLQMAANDVQQTLKQSIPYGYAFLVWNPQTKNLIVTVSVTGLMPHSVHPSHIHQGSCASMGAIVYPLNNVVADEHGNAFTTTTISGVANGIAASGWYINVHHGPGLATPAQMAPIYCGNISNPAPNTSHLQIIRVRLQGV